MSPVSQSTKTNRLTRLFSFSTFVHLNVRVNKPVARSRVCWPGSTHVGSQLIQMVPHGHGRGHFLPSYELTTFSDYSREKSILVSTYSMSGFPIRLASSLARCQS